MTVTPKMFTDAPPRIEIPFATYTGFLSRASNSDPYKLLAHQLDLQTSKSNTVKPGYITVYNVTDYSTFGMTQVLGLHSEGVKTYEYPAYIERTVAQMSDNVPAGFPGATYTPVDENGVEGDEVTRTWTEWAAAYGRGVQDLTGGTKGFELSNGNKHFGSDEFVVLYAAGITPLDRPTYTAKIPVVSE